MNYYEIKSPYWAIVQADTKDKALDIYSSEIVEDDGSFRDEIKEVNRDYALVVLSRIETDGKTEKLLTIAEVLDKFHEKEECILAFDGSLFSEIDRPQLNSEREKDRDSMFPNMSNEDIEEHLMGRFNKD